MTVAADYLPPEPLSWIWLGLGFALLVLIAAWYAGMLILTARRKQYLLPPPKPIAPPKALDTLRAEALASIEAAVAQHADGTLSRRVLTQHLSSIVRNFTFQACGLPAPTLTLADLRTTPFASLTQLIDVYYPGEFARRSGDEESTDAVATAAREYVTRWN